MIPYVDALQLVQSRARNKLPTERVELHAAVGRVAAEDIVADLPNPSFRNSAMDGYALIAQQTADINKTSPKHFAVVGATAAGREPIFGVGLKDHILPTAVEIMTGAYLPEPFDTVARVEDVRPVDNPKSGARIIEVSQPYAPQENVRLIGEDFESGQKLVSAGRRIRPQDVMALAAIGRPTLRVRVRPRMGLLATGRELVEVGSCVSAALPAGKIFNSTQPFLKSVLERTGAEAISYGIAPDRPEDFFVLMDKALGASLDGIITTGAVSMGRYDFIPQALRDLGATIHFHKARIRPGKPILFATVKAKSGNEVAFFGLPGNPISSAVGWAFFIQPYLALRLGLKEARPLFAEVTRDIKKRASLRTFVFGELSLDNGKWTICVPARQQSFMLRPSLEAHAWAILPEGKEVIKAGEYVECRLFSHVGLDA